MINNIIRECSELAQKQYKLDATIWGKMTHWKLRKKLKFDYFNKWYMDKTESVMENET